MCDFCVFASFFSIISVYQTMGAAVMYVKFVWQIAAVSDVFKKCSISHIGCFVGPIVVGPTERI